VSLQEALRGLWGSSAGQARANALRVHVRNLRARLAAAGLRNAVQSRRGRGYALVL
jgi:DNA-binding response OmpR family regulator